MGRAARSITGAAAFCAGAISQDEKGDYMQTVSLKKRANEARALKKKVDELRQIGEIEESLRLEKKYLELRMSVLNEIEDEVRKRAALPLAEIKEQVAREPILKKISTGIESLDDELVNEEEYRLRKPGGLTLGNFVQIAGSRGAGKTTLLMKIFSHLSRQTAVSWFDFEMGRRRFVSKISRFEANDENFFYYSASRELDDIVDEIRLAYADGVRHFVIDSAMKISVSKSVERYERFSLISSKLSELTSSLQINIFLINQMSQSSIKEHELSLKHGNDAEYDADLIFFVLKPKKTKNGKPIRDEFGQDVLDDSKRVIYCTKNRQDERLFSLIIEKNEIFGTGKEIVYYFPENL